jgi:hypothetical protein
MFQPPHSSPANVPFHKASELTAHVGQAAFSILQLQEDRHMTQMAAGRASLQTCVTWGTNARLQPVTVML